MESVKILTAFFSTESGTAKRTIKVLRQIDFRNKWASTRVVTNSIRLDRMLLHSRATSTVTPGIEMNIPFCMTGMPNAAKSNRVAFADCCCRKTTIRSSANSGSGTRQNRKRRANNNRCEIRLPKQNTKEPSHQVTRAVMFIARWTSGDKLGVLHRLKQPIRIDSSSNPRAFFDPCAGAELADFHSRKIKAAATGKIKRMCVYSSLFSASLKVLTTGRPQKTRETANRKTNCSDGDSFLTSPLDGPDFYEKRRRSSGSSDFYGRGITALISSETTL